MAGTLCHTCGCIMFSTQKRVLRPLGSICKQRNSFRFREIKKRHKKKSFMSVDKVVDSFKIVPCFLTCVFSSYDCLRGCAVLMFLIQWVANGELSRLAIAMTTCTLHQPHGMLSLIEAELTRSFSTALSCAVLRTGVGRARAHPQTWFWLNIPDENALWRLYGSNIRWLFRKPNDVNWEGSQFRSETFNPFNWKCDSYDMAILHPPFTETDVQFGLRNDSHGTKSRQDLVARQQAFICRMYISSNILTRLYCGAVQQCQRVKTRRESVDT